MSDIRKLLDLINETTVAGSVAPMAAPIGKMQERVEETATEETKKPEVIEYGMWENSALATTSKLKKNRGKSAKVVKSIYGEDVQSEAANPKQQAAIAIAKKKEVAEGKFTINAKTGAKLDPRTGAELPPKEKPLTMKQMFTQPKQPKLSLDDVWMKIQSVVSNIYPDGDPIDHLAPWLEKHGIRDFKIGEILDRAAKKNGYKDLYDYWDSMGDLPLSEQGVAEGSKQDLPIVLYKEISPDQTQGREFFQIVKSQSPLWKVGDTFSDDDMSMGSQQVRFVSVEQGVAEGSEDKNAQQRKVERDKQRTAPAQKVRNTAQRKGLTQDKDGTYYAKEGVAEGLLNELSKDTLKSYTKKANDEVNVIKKKRADDPRGRISGADFDKKQKRQIGLTQASRRIEKKDLTGVAEETEQIDEISMEKLLKYVPNAVADLSDRDIRINTGKATANDAKKVQDRKKGLSRAAGKIGYKMAPESVAEGSLNEGQYEMMMRNGQVKRFVAKDDADAKRIAKGHGAKSVIRLKGGVPAGKVSEQSMAEGTLEESDLILNPASLSKLSRDLVSHEQDRTDHEVEMAKSDLYQAGKNAVKVFELIRDISEEEGLEGWVQEKIIKANDYLNTVREYLEGKQMESMDGVAPGTKMFTSEEKAGLWANIHAKRKRIKAGSGEHMRKPGSKGAPSAQDFKDAAK